MSGIAKTIMRSLSPRIVAKAITVFDKSTAIVVGSCWGVALIALVLAVMAVHSTVALKRDLASAISAEPVMPEASTVKINEHEAQALLDRLAHQFPDVKFELDGNQGITLRATDGTKFHQWVTALSYVDTMSPKYRWSLREFCVGKCSGQELMKAVVSGQKVNYNLPQVPQ